MPLAYWGFLWTIPAVKTNVEINQHALRKLTLATHAPDDKHWFSLGTAVRLGKKLLLRLVLAKTMLLGGQMTEFYMHEYLPVCCIAQICCHCQNCHTCAKQWGIPQIGQKPSVHEWDIDSYVMTLQCLSCHALAYAITANGACLHLLAPPLALYTASLVLLAM